MGLNLSSLLDPGALAHQLVDSFLPKDMQWVGGVVGAAVDYQCGNEVGAVKQGVSALSDLKDVPQSAPANKPAAGASTDAANKTTPSSTQAAPNQRWTYEPSPPQPRVTTTTTTTTTTVTSGPGTAPKAATTPATTPTTSSAWRAARNLSTSTSSATPKASQPASGGWRSSVRPEPSSPRLVGHPPAQTATVAGATGPASQTVTTTKTTTTTTGATPSAPTMRPPSTGSDLVRLAAESAARVQTAAASSSKPASGAAAAPSATPESTAPAKASAGASSAAAAAKPSSADPSTLSKDNFMNLSDDDLMKAVREGKIPTDVTDSQAGMMALQARMDHISEMNKMMTSMMEAMHQMKMGVIENLRA